MNAPNTSAASTSVEDPSRSRRKKGIVGVLVIVLIVGLVWAMYAWFFARRFEFTDNAYVQGNVVQITPQIGGTVMAILADDTDFVKAGQPLVKLDPADAQLALKQAKAALAQAVRQVRTLYANNGVLSAQIQQKQADLARAQSDMLMAQTMVTRTESDLVRAREDLARRQSLKGKGAVSAEELQHVEAQLITAKSAYESAQANVVSAQSNVKAAQSAVAVVREQLISNQALTQGTSVEMHPNVQAAAAKMREAYLAVQRVTLPAPVDGFVARRTVQLGQRVAAGSPMMSVIALDQLWVDANFKEVQLRQIRLGQTAKLTADVYGKKVEYHGTVVGLGAGTGAVFALLPAQNATGNWIKVVQRVPVRIALDPQELVANPLRLGLSMLVSVDISNQTGASLADASRPPAMSQTAVYEALEDGAEAEIRQVIAAHLGQVGAVVKPEKFVPPTPAPTPISPVQR